MNFCYFYVFYATITSYSMHGFDVMRLVSRLIGPSRQTHRRAARRCSRLPHPKPRSGCCVDRYRTPGECVTTLRALSGAQYRCAWQGQKFVPLCLRNRWTDVSISDHHMTLEIASLGALAQIRRSARLGRVRTALGSAVRDWPQHSPLLEALLSVVGNPVGAAAMAKVLGPVWAADSVSVAIWGLAGQGHYQILCVRYEDVGQYAGRRDRHRQHLQAVNCRHSCPQLFLVPIRGVATKHLGSTSHCFQQVDHSNQHSPRTCLTAVSADSRIHFSN